LLESVRATKELSEVPQVVHQAGTNRLVNAEAALALLLRITNEDEEEEEEEDLLDDKELVRVSAGLHRELLEELLLAFQHLD